MAMPLIPHYQQEWLFECVGNPSQEAGGLGKTTAEMQTLATFTSEGWDFSNTDESLLSKQLPPPRFLSAFIAGFTHLVIANAFSSTRFSVSVIFNQKVLQRK